MQVLLKNTLTVLLLVFAASVSSNNGLSSWFTKGENHQIYLRVNLFLSSTCPHCEKANAFFHSLEKKKSYLNVHRYVINKDKAALETFHQQLRELGYDDYAVPAIFFCNTRWVGFDDANTTGQNLSRGLEYCYQQINQQGKLTQQNINILKQWANASWFGANMTRKPSLAEYTLLMAVADAFSSCSLFGILALFSFLWLYKERGVMIGLSALFLLTMMIVHYFQQDYTASFYQVLNLIRAPVILIGLGLVSYVLFTYLKGVDPYPNYAVPVLVCFTAAAVQAYQQNCTPNFGLVYQLWLDAQGISNLQRQSIGIIYQLIYILPLVLGVLLFIYFRGDEKFQKLDPLLVHTSWCLLLIIGILLIVFPHGLSYFTFSLASLGLSLLAGWLIIKNRAS